MNGSVREVRPGYYQLRVYVGVDPATHRSVYRTKAVGRMPSRRAAARLLPAFYVEAHSEPFKPAQGTLATLVTDVLGHLRSRSREATTMAGYEHIAGQVCAVLGSVIVAELTPQHLDAYYSSLMAAGRSSGTVQNHHRFIHRALALAVKWGRVETNVAKRAEPPPVWRNRGTAPANDRVVALIDAAREMDPTAGVALMLCAALGCRRGEVLGLRWSDLIDDGERRAIRIRRAVKQVTGRIIVADTKTHQERTVAVGGGVILDLAHHELAMVDRAKWAGTKLTQASYIISDAADGSVPWRPDRLTKIVVRLRDKVGYVGRLHDLRHWNTSELLDAGEDVTVVAGRQGHSDASTTHSVYAHMRPAGDVRAAALLDERLFGHE